MGDTNGSTEVFGEPEAHERARVAEACRALTHAGVLSGVLGHVSLRLEDGALLVRSRGPDEQGLRFSRPGDVMKVDSDGDALDDRSDVRAPNELPIHTAVMRRRPDVNAVVHAHPYHTLLVGIADLDLVPLVGAYNIPATRLAANDRIARFPRAALINDWELASQLAANMGTRNACLLRGHGIVTCGATLEEAVITAVDLEQLCRVTIDVHRLGVAPRPISDEDLTQLPDLGAAFNADMAYRALVASERAASTAG